MNSPPLSIAALDLTMCRSPAGVSLARLGAGDNRVFGFAIIDATTVTPAGTPRLYWRERGH